MISIPANVQPGRKIHLIVVTDLLSVAITIFAPPALAQNKKCAFETADSQTLAECLIRPTDNATKGIRAMTI
jgi:hypothetical protein